MCFSSLLMISQGFGSFICFVVVNFVVVYVCCLFFVCFACLFFLWFTNQLSNSKLERGIKAGNVNRNKRNIETSKKHQNFNLTAISYGDMCSVCSYKSENSLAVLLRLLFLQNEICNFS